MPQSTQPSTIVVSSGGGSTKTIVLGLLAVGGAFFGYKAFEKYKKNQSEKELDTEAGQIALQLKNVFDSTIVSAEDYRVVAIKINATNKDDVYKIYRGLTQRNLSDDISRLPSGTLVRAAKTEAINNKPNGVIKIRGTDDIQFLVSKGSKVKFTDSNKAITLYANPKGLIYDLSDPKVKPKISALDRIKVVVSKRKEILTVDGTLIFPYDGVKLAEDWTKYIRPIVATRKVFALVRVAVKAQSGFKYLWVDARELSLASNLKGSSMDGLYDISQLVF